MVTVLGAGMFGNNFVRWPHVNDDSMVNDNATTANHTKFISTGIEWIVCHHNRGSVHGGCHCTP